MPEICPICGKLHRTQAELEEGYEDPEELPEIRSDGDRDSG